MPPRTRTPPSDAPTAIPTISVVVNSNLELSPVFAFVSWPEGTSVAVASEPDSVVDCGGSCNVADSCTEVTASETVTVCSW